MEKLRKELFVISGLSILFSLLNVGLSLVAIISFLFSLGFSALFAFFVFKTKRVEKTASKIQVLRKFLEYLPFVLLAQFILRRATPSNIPFAFDLFLVLLWAGIFFFSLFIIFCLHPKRIAKKFSGIGTIKEPSKPKGKLQWFAMEILSWLDAFFQAALLVSLVHIFVFQFYEIPSESMVREFLVGDRVLVFKTASGPTFPLSKVAIPRMRGYKRGDIVTFRNPHYIKDEASETKNFVSQLVFMLTFTMVNLNVDDDGNIKYDPLVKRICGEPGEQLMMVDGQLYARRSGNDKFIPVEEKWAHWNLNDLDGETKQKIRLIPFDSETYSMLEAAEEERRNFDLKAAATEAIDLAEKFSDTKMKIRAVMKNAPKDVPYFAGGNYSVRKLFSSYDEITRDLLMSPMDDQWFEKFLCGWIGDGDFDFGDDLYSEALFKYNVMAKIYFGKLALKSAEFVLDGKSITQLSDDEDYRKILSGVQNLDVAINLLDGRSMPIFPANENGKSTYIPENRFFMMGDNRFNSLDMRHSYSQKTIPLTDLDEQSIVFLSKVSPQLVEAKHILGGTVFRFWPPSRIGIPGVGYKK